MKTNAERKVFGFTLIELLTVIAIIGVLAGILIPVISSARYSGKQSKSLNQLRSIGQAAWLYAAENKQQFPTLRTNGTAPLWTHHLYGYMEPYAVGSGFWCSPTLVDPLVDAHNVDFGDYGANDQVFTEPAALKTNATKNPAGVAMVMTARNGDKVSYHVFAPGYINNPSRTDNMPHARAKGNVLAVMVDGHVSSFQESDFVARRVALLNPAY